MNNKIFFTGCFIFFGLSILFFPKSLDPVKFLGFSKPVLLEKSIVIKKNTSQKRKLSNTHFL